MDTEYTAYFRLEKNCFFGIIDAKTFADTEQMTRGKNIQKKKQVLFIDFFLHICRVCVFAIHSYLHLDKFAHQPSDTSEP